MQLFFPVSFVGVIFCLILTSTHVKKPMTTDFFTTNTGTCVLVKGVYYYMSITTCILPTCR